jgi:hypothetical protein
MLTKKDAMKERDAATTVYEIDPLCDPRWATLVESHGRASVFHSVNWLKALRAMYDYEPVAITTCAPGVPLTNGLVFCRINSWLTGRRFVSLPFSDHCNPLTDSSDELDEMLWHMQQYVDNGACKYVEIRPSFYEQSSRSRLDNGLTYYFHSLDLCKSTEELFHNFHKDCVQRKIKRAERENVKYEEGRSELLLQKFYNLLVMTRRRQYLPPQPLSWFRGLIAAFGDNLKIRLASQNDLPVASILTLSHKKTMVYKYGCSDARFNRLGGTPLLFWKTIQEAADNGFKELDMGRSDTDNLGLIAFKEHWGATGVPLRYWIYPHELVTSPSSWQKRLARQLVPVTPDSGLKAVGKLFYKHIG